jgi:SAM-dependent methyltransferase
MNQTWNEKKRIKCRSNSDQKYTIAPDQTHHLNEQGLSAYEQRFDQVLSFHSPGLAAVRDQTGSYHIKSDGNALYKKRYSRTFGFYCNRAAVKKGNHYFHIDPEGFRCYSKNYAWTGNYQEDKCVVRGFKGQYFHINLQGQPCYPQRFKYTGDFKYGIAVARHSNGNAIHINPKGQQIHEHEYRDLDIFHKSFARACDSSGWFHITRKGKSIYSERYKEIEPFYNGLARVITFQDTIGIINETGTWVKTIDDIQEHPSRLIRQIQSLCDSYWPLQTVIAAIKLKFFDTVGNRTWKLMDLASHLQMDMEELKLLCQALKLEQFIILRQKIPPKDPNSPASNFSLHQNMEISLTQKGLLMTQNHPNSQRAPVLIFGEEHYHAWNHLDRALNETSPQFEKIYGEPYFQWIHQHPIKASIYYQGLMQYAKKDYQPIIKKYLFPHHPRVLDLGGGSGALLNLYLKAYPKSKGILIDLPLSIEFARQYFRKEGTINRIQLESYNFFNPLSRIIKESVDAVFLSRILHDWDDSHASKILQNIGSILKPEGRLYLFEIVKPSRIVHDHGVYLSLNMRVITGGKERTLNQFRQLLEENGFSLTSTTKIGLLNIIVGKKQNVGEV